MSIKPFLLWAALLSGPAWSASAPQAVAAPSAFMSLVQVVFALMLVLGAIVGCAYLVRRLGGGALGGSRDLRVVGGVMVGQKERVVIVESGDEWLVLGVTAHNVSLLSRRDKPEGAELPPQPPLPENFARLFKSVLAKSKS
ncbi:flagellar biosynthetic protein FliO [Craterilacuibacter sinensis]|nr:flagellar biosynthetic protein FliO [Craterilacuibacter sinensis]